MVFLSDHFKDKEGQCASPEAAAFIANGRLDEIEQSVILVENWCRKPMSEIPPEILVRLQSAYFMLISLRGVEGIKRFFGQIQPQKPPEWAVPVAKDEFRKELGDDQC